jgi:hypothetical protein
VANKAIVWSRAPLGASCGLDLSQNGLQLTVDAGSFRVGGVDYELMEAAECDLTPDADYGMDVWGHLVKNAETGEISVLVDEVLRDGEDAPYTFGATYHNLHVLFVCEVEAAMATLDDAKLTLFWLGAPEEE